jgi:transposase-like protein
MNKSERSQYAEEQRIKIVSCFEKHAGNVSAVARELNIERSTVRHHLRSAHAGEKPLAGGNVAGGTKETKESLPRKGVVKRYILTSAQNNTHVHGEFWKNLLALAEHYSARIMVGTFSYNQNHYGKLAVKAGTEKTPQDNLWFDAALIEHLCDRRVTLAPGLVWCGEMNIQPTEQNPLSGLETYAHQSSAIFPHTKLEMRSVATTQDLPVKLIYTTGTVTQMNYIQKKAGLKAEHHHRYAFLLVEVDSTGSWWVRQVAARKNGACIQDLDVLVENGAVTSTKASVEAITWGDLHTTCAEPLVVSSSLNMLDALRPKFQFIHDIMEGASINRHIRNHKCVHEQFKTYLRGLTRLEAELKATRAGLEKYLRPWCKTVVPDSNHDGWWLKCWLREFDYRCDPGNAELFLKLQAFMYSEIRTGKFPKDVNITERALVTETGLASGAITFLLPDESFTVCGDIECGMHGHIGPNGSQGTPNNLSKIGKKATTAHTHTAGIYHGLYVAGTSSKLRWDYTYGPSSWTHSHVVCYPNGQRTVITLRGGKWRAE